MDLNDHEQYDSFFSTAVQDAEYRKGDKRRSKGMRFILIGFSCGIVFGFLSPFLAKFVPAVISILPAMASGVAFLAGVFYCVTGDYDKEKYEKKCGHMRKKCGRKRRLTKR